jgi:predicted MPP superfamily phosphohydrolase
MTKSKTPGLRVQWPGIGIILLVFLLTGCRSKPVIESPAANAYNFFVVSDMGSSGPYREDSVAHTVNRLAKVLHPQFVVNQGDFFHNNGVKDTLDPLWSAQFEQMFSAPELQLKWYSIIGNHEYIGNPQALVDYGKHNARWTMPSRNYTFVKQVDSLTSVRFVMLDTSPFVYIYRFDSKYHQIKSQDPDKTVAFADSVLSHSKETWKVVVGHHPIYTSDFVQGNTYDLIYRIAPLLRKYKVDFYLNGHVHKFEHLQRDGIDYMVTTTGMKPRWTNPWFYARYVGHSLGFTVCSVTHKEFCFYFVNEKGETVYSYKRIKDKG